MCSKNSGRGGQPAWNRCTASQAKPNTAHRHRANSRAAAVALPPLFFRQSVALLALIEQGRKAGSEYHGKKGHGQRGQEQNHGQDLHTHFTIFFRHWRMISSRDRVSTSTPFSAWATSALV